MEEHTLVALLLVIVALGIIYGLVQGERSSSSQQRAQTTTVAGLHGGMHLLRVWSPDSRLVDKIADVTARAFVDSPSYVYVFESLGSKAARLEGLRFLFQRNLKLQQELEPGCIHVVVRR